MPCPLPPPPSPPCWETEEWGGLGGGGRFGRSGRGYGLGVRGKGGVRREDPVPCCGSTRGGPRWPSHGGRRQRVAVVLGRWPWAMIADGGRGETEWRGAGSDPRPHLEPRRRAGVGRRERRWRAEGLRRRRWSLGGGAARGGCGARRRGWGLFIAAGRR